MYLTKYLLTHKLSDSKSVLVNTLSGAIDLIDNRYLPLLNSPQNLTPETEIWQPLLERGYLFPSRQAETAELNRMFQDYTHRKQPLTFVVCPTYACNLRCDYCFEGSLTQEQPRVLDGVEVEAIFAAIDRLATSESHIQLFGGEPLLPTTYKPVKRLLELAQVRGLTVSAVTNGVHVTDFMPLLLQFRDQLGDFQITIDGPAAVHDARRPRAGGQGSFVSIVRGVVALLAAGIHVRLRVNVDQRNLGNLVELAQFIHNHGWDELPHFQAILSPVDDHTGRELPGRLSEHETAGAWFKLRAEHPELALFRVDLFRNLEYLMTTIGSDQLSFPRFQYCESNNLSCYTFGTDGNIYLCAEAVGDDRHAVGRYYPEFTLNEVAISRWANRSVLTLEACQDCAVATFCGGGCAISAANINGSLDTPYCHGALETIHSYLDSIKQQILDGASHQGNDYISSAAKARSNSAGASTEFSGLGKDPLVTSSR